MNIIRNYKWLNIPMLILVLLISSYFVSIIVNAPLISIVCALFFIIILVFFNLRYLSGKNQVLIYLLIILMKIELLIYQATFKNLPLGGLDWQHYHRFGQELLSFANGNLLTFFTLENYDLFTRITALIYYFFGINPEQMYFFVFITSLLTFNYIYLTSYEILKNKIVSQKIALLFMVWPIEFIHSITFLREMPIQLLFIASLYHFVKFINYKRSIDVFLAIVLISLSSMMHSGMIGVLITYVLIVIISNKKRGIDSLNPFKIAIFVVIVFLFLQSPISAPLTAKFGGVDNINDLIENRIQYKDAGMEATTNYISQIPDSPSALLLQFPYLIVMYSLSPLPWQVTNFSTLIAFFIEGIPRLFIVYMLIKYFIKYKPKTPKEKQLKMTFMILILLTYLIFSLGTKSYGTAMRHRAKIFPLEIILVYSAININKRNRKYNIDLGSPELKKRKDGN